MKNNSTRITVEYIINTIISGITLLIGLAVIIGCIGLFGELGDALEEAVDNEYMRVFVAPFILIGYILLAIFVFFVGFVPLYTGVVTGALTHLARFRYSENGTLVTKGYKRLMRAVYIVYGVVLSTYGVGFVCIIRDMLTTNYP